MTTTITIKTHDWPALVETIDEYSGPGVETYSRRVETVKPNSEKSFFMTSTRSLRFEELPVDG